MNSLIESLFITDVNIKHPGLLQNCERTQIHHQLFLTHHNNQNKLNHLKKKFMCLFEKC